MQLNRRPRAKGSILTFHRRPTLTSIIPKVINSEILSDLRKDLTQRLVASHKHINIEWLKVLSEIKVPIDASPEKLIAFYTNRSSLMMTLLLRGKTAQRHCMLLLNVKGSRFRLYLLIMDLPFVSFEGGKASRIEL